MQINSGKVKKNMQWFPPHRLRYILHQKGRSNFDPKKKSKRFLACMFEAVLGSRFWISGIAEWAKYRLQTVFAMFWKKFDNFNLSDFTYVLFVFLEFSFSSYMRSGIFFLCSLIVIWRNLKKKNSSKFCSLHLHCSLITELKSEN